MDLGLTDVVIPVRFVSGIRDHRNNPISKVGNGLKAAGFMRYKPNQGYEIQILNWLTTYDKLFTTLHEARHVFQHKNKWWNNWVWQGERISKRTFYEDLPWEYDANLYARRRLRYIANAAGYDIDNEL